RELHARDARGRERCSDDRARRTQAMKEHTGRSVPVTRLAAAEDALPVDPRGLADPVGFVERPADDQMEQLRAWIVAFRIPGEAFGQRGRGGPGHRPHTITGGHGPWTDLTDLIGGGSLRGVRRRAGPREGSP